MWSTKTLLLTYSISDPDDGAGQDVGSAGDGEAMETQSADGKRQQTSADKPGLLHVHMLLAYVTHISC